MMNVQLTEKGKLVKQVQLRRVKQARSSGIQMHFNLVAPRTLRMQFNPRGRK